MATKHKLEDAFFAELKDVLSAEKQILQALPKMVEKASSPDLKEAFESHRKETEKQVERLEAAFKSLDKTPRSEKCEAMAGILEEGKEILEMDAEPDVHDAMLIAAAQKVEHYEIATYGTLCTWADLLGFSEASKLLKQTMDEEESADKKLTTIAKTVNSAANV